MIVGYQPADWFWIVAEDPTRAWSSAAVGYVTEWDPHRTTNIGSEEELTDVLHVHGLQGPLVTEAHVMAERKRRLAKGFAYDFGDTRGVHHIGTTEADMAGWDEVSKVAQAAVLVGLPATLISIETNTGSVTISAQEWQQILLAAGRFRQPIWKAAFDLVKLDPIPSNYQEDQYWS